MPIYEYRCSKCQHTFEVIQKMSDPPMESCSECSGRLEKLVSRGSFQLRGGGWFTSAYGRGGTQAPADAADTGSNGAKDSTSDRASAPKSTDSPAGCGSGSCGCGS